LKQKDYLRLRRQIEDKYRADIDALERVWQMAQPPESPAKAETPRIEGLTEAVRGLLRTVPEPFNLRSVIGRLNEHPDQNIAQAARSRPASVSTVLKRLEKTGEIRLLEKGSGKRASSYARGNPPVTALPVE